MLDRLLDFVEVRYLSRAFRFVFDRVYQSYSKKSKDLLFFLLLVVFIACTFSLVWRGVGEGEGAGEE